MAHSRGTEGGRADSEIHDLRVVPRLHVPGEFLALACSAPEPGGSRQAPGPGAPRPATQVCSGRHNSIHGTFQRLPPSVCDSGANQWRVGCVWHRSRFAEIDFDAPQFAMPTKAGKRGKKKGGSKRGRKQLPLAAAGKEAYSDSEADEIEAKELAR